MNEVLIKAFLPAAVVSFVISVFVLITPVAFGKAVYDSRINVTTKVKGVSQADIDRVIKEAEIALNSVPALLGLEFNKGVKIKIMEKGPCRTTRDKIVLLGQWHVKNKRAPIVHEVTHVIAGKHRNNKFFNEGLAEFIQGRFGEDAGGITYYKEPQYLSHDDLVIKYGDNLISLYYLKHKNEVFSFKNKNIENRKLAYIESASFIKFLYEKYGEHKLQDLYHSRNLDYEKVYGKNINELEKEWLNYVFVELPASNPSTQYHIGMLAEDVNKALHWYVLAAEGGYLKAQLKLGDLYSQGREVQLDYGEAIKWYTKAGNQGDIRAQRKLAQCYIESGGDYFKAYAWLTLATEQGSNMSQKKKDEIAEKMSPEEIASANEYIKEIKAALQY